MMLKAALTGQPLHPGGLINTEVVEYDFHDASQQLIEVFCCDICAKLALHLREVLRSSFPPTR